jgi:Spy/CpxP family protein refolding chaperone
MRAQFEAMRKKITDGVNNILTDTQKKRVKEIQIQLAGNAAAADATVQKTLNLTEDQKSKIAALVKSQAAANRSVFENMRSGLIEQDQAQESLKKNKKTLSDMIGKVLTADQAASLTALGGKPFTATEQDRGFGGPGGGGV